MRIISRLNMATKPAATTYAKVSNILDRGLRAVERQTDYTKMLSGASNYMTQARAALGAKPKSGAALADYRRAQQAINDFSSQVGGMVAGSYSSGVQSRVGAVEGILKEAREARARTFNIDEQLQISGSYVQQARMALGPKPRSGQALADYNKAELAINAFADRATKSARNLMAAKANETYSAGRQARSGVQRELGAGVSIHASKNPLNWVRVGKPPAGRVSGSLSGVKEKVDDATGYVDEMMQRLRDSGLATPGSESYAKGLKADLSRFTKAIERQETKHQTYATERENERVVKAGVKGAKRRARASSAADELVKLRASRRY